MKQGYTNYLKWREPNLESTINKAKNIKMIISDVDGVLTDGKIIIANNGEELKTFNSQDGMGINLAQKLGIRFAIITGRISRIVEIRAEELNIKDVYQDVDDKVEVFELLIDKYNLCDEEVAYIGDDLNDIPILNRAGLAATVANGVKKVKDTVDYIATRKGGEGAVREIIDFIIACRD